MLTDMREIPTGLTGSRSGFETYFAAALERLRAERRYRVFADIERKAGQFPHATWHSPDGPRPITVWCSIISAWARTGT
jgi:hypothetical protein